MSLPPVRASKRGQTHTVIRQGKAPEGVEERMVDNPFEVGPEMHLVALPVAPEPPRNPYDPDHDDTVDPRKIADSRTLQAMARAMEEVLEAVRAGTIKDEDW